MSISAPETAPDASQEVVFNVPNQVTFSRLVLAIVCFVLIGLEHYLAGMIVFLVAACTDWVDGYWARRFKQVTQLGRNFDPFVDKIIICGTYIFLAAEYHKGATGSHVAAWMVVVVVGRELMVTALRSFLEQQGSDFSAAMSGKIKFVLQCAVAAFSLFMLDYEVASRYTFVQVRPPAWLEPTLTVAVWAMIVMTIYSGVAYIFAAAKLLRRRM